MFSEVLSFYKTVGGPTLSLALQVLRGWWWLIFPFVMQKPFLFLWRKWRTDHWIANVFNPVVYEIKIPKDILKPVRAMEDVLNSLHSVIYQPADWWETWIDGQFQTSISLEITSIEGEIHFYIRFHKGYLDGIKASIYSQYPDVEMAQVDDYTKLVPQDIPNKDWELWATDYILARNDCYPILTYKSFEKEMEPVEEKIVDPVASLLESMSRIGPGEQFWIQIAITPMAEDVAGDWVKKSEAKRDELAKRKSKPSDGGKPIVLGAMEALITGKTPEELNAAPKEKETMIPPEMRLTPGERNVIEAIEEKAAKPLFKSAIRFIFLGKRALFNKAKLRLGFTFFGSFKTQNLNLLVPMGKTLTKIHKSWFLPLNMMRARRIYLRERKIFRNYLSRVPPFYPRPGGDFVLNIEEVASLYHFPSWRVSPVPGLSRIEARKKPAPTLPME